MLLIPMFFGVSNINVTVLENAEGVLPTRIPKIHMNIIYPCTERVDNDCLNFKVIDDIIFGPQPQHYTAEVCFVESISLDPQS